MTALVARARATALAAFAMGLAACAVAPRAPRAQPAADAGEVVMPPPLRLDPLASIVSGTGLEWLADVHPRELLSDEAAAAQVERVFSETAAARFRTRYGGVDLLRAQEIVVAGYDGALFGAVRAAVDAMDPSAIEAAFARRAQGVEGRVQAGSVVRFWGTVDGAREQVAVFGHQAVAIEHGQLGPLRPAVLFAEGKLQRALPATHAEPLAALFARLQDAPPPPVAMAFYAPGPFAEPWASGLGGLLRATTAAAVAATCAATTPRPDGGAQFAGGAGRPGLRVRVVLAGSWGADGPAAGERLAAAFRALAADPLGRLAGLDHPLTEPSLVTDDAAVELDVTLDLASLAVGIHDATGASLPEILGLSAAH